MNPKAIQTAKRALELAAADRGITPNPNAVRFMLGQVLAESSFGADVGTLRGTNNYGAIHSAETFRRAHSGQANWGEVAHRDHLADGRAYIEWFRVYPSQLDGARDFLATVAHLTDLGSVSTAEAYSRDLFRGHYYVGFGNSDEERIAGYRSFIESHLPAIDAALASGVEPDDPHAVKVGPFASFLERLFVKSESDARSEYGPSFDAVQGSDGVRMFNASSSPSNPSSARRGAWPVLIALGAAIAVAAAARLWRF